MNNNIEMTVSPICNNNNEKYAFVLFTDGDKTAEGKIPDCVITANKGFSKEEIEQLESYMKNELTGLKKMAAGINVVSAFMK